MTSKAVFLFIKNQEGQAPAIEVEQAGNKPLYLFAISIVALLLLPNLFCQGMFMDGLQYACVSKNMALGKGTFWFPFLTRTWWYEMNSFLEHPPLFYTIQSWFFRIVGNEFYTEKIFCLFVALINAFTIGRIWRLTANKFGLERSLDWLVIVLWITIPICFWAFQNNAIETLVTFFDLLAIYYSLKAIEKNRFSYLFLLLAGTFIFLATLTKGVPGLFPLVVIPIHFLFFREISIQKTILFSLIVFLIPVCIYSGLLLFNHAAHKSLTFYFHYRLLNRINKPPPDEYWWFTLEGLSQELIPIFIVGILLFLSKRKSSPAKTDIKVFWFFISIGLSGVLPLMLTLVQKKFYFLPALPLFALGFVALFGSRIKPLIAGLTDLKLFKPVVIALSTAIIVCSVFLMARNFGGYCREEETQKEVAIIGEVIKNDSIVGAENATLYSDWSLQFYLLRKFDVGVEEFRQSRPREHLITQNTIPDSTIWKQIILPTKKYHLYEAR